MVLPSFDWMGPLPAGMILLPSGMSRAGSGFTARNMEISISRKGDLQILGVKGKIRLQNWRVLNKHLETMLDHGARWVAMDLTDVALICSTGIGSIMHNVRRFRDGDSNLLVVAASPYIQEMFEAFGCGPLLGRSLFADWPALEDHLRSQSWPFPLRKGAVPGLSRSS